MGSLEGVVRSWMWRVESQEAEMRRAGLGVSCCILVLRGGGGLAMLFAVCDGLDGLLMCT